MLTAGRTRQAAAAGAESDTIAAQLGTDAELVQTMDIRDGAFGRWRAARDRAVDAQLGAADVSGSFAAATRAFRLLLQSAMLGLGAFLVLRGELTPGAMIAGSILLGRALAPVELAIGQWPLVQQARQGWYNLAELLSAVAPEAPRTALPRPRAHLRVQSLTVVPPGQSQAALRALSFAVEPGQAVGVIGPSGAGKSTLARALTGLWRPAGGSIRLDGAALDQYPPSELGRHIGYLPQRVQLFDGSIAENIARLSANPDSEQVVAAAKLAGAHAMIVHLPDGYDTRVSAAGGRLSGGQIQRLGLARALYGAPVLLVLDEPNANLDNQGSQALNAAIRAIKARGGAVLIMAHRPAAIEECDTLLVLENGQRAAFGPRDEVLRRVVQNQQQIRDSKGKSGGVQ
jgi:ATP-binding cassette subfamily C protein